ncbi:hypothetical protein RZN25_18505 [Bacillaceae bacterium S4-13-56]
MNKKKFILFLAVLFVVAGAYVVYDITRNTTYGEVLNDYEINQNSVENVKITHYEYRKGTNSYDKFEATTSDTEFIDKILNEPSDIKLKESKPCDDLPDFDLQFNKNGSSYMVTLCDNNITLVNSTVIDSTKEIGEYEIVGKKKDIFHKIIMKSNLNWKVIRD